ncbi:MAG: winged helix DNA-binding domain-containing protein [Anaerolineae bacterium]
MNIGLTRLHNQLVSHPRFTQPVDVVKWLGVMQGQDYAGAKWSIGLRLPTSTDAEVEQSIANYQIVRTWVLRGTLHVVAGADVRWMVELVAPRLIAGLATRHRQLELDEATFRRSNDLFVTALAGGQERTRKQLLAFLEENGVSTQGQRGYHLLGRAGLDGLLVQSVEIRKDATYMLRDEALPSTRLLPRDEAVAELAQRYFHSRGPATVQDFAHWSGLTLTDARAGLEAVKSQLVDETIDGETYWLPPYTSSSPNGAHMAYALPGFDEYLLGYKDRSAVLDPLHATKVCPGGNGIFFPTIVIDGHMVGTWKRTVAKGKMAITTAPFESLSRSEKDTFVKAAGNYAAFMQIPLANVD